MKTFIYEPGSNSGVQLRSVKTKISRRNVIRLAGAAAMDNLEWTDGFGTRFGLVYVNFKTHQRIPKLSAQWFLEGAWRNAVV